MVDWEGLLKFSIKYSDGTKATEFKQMSNEDKKWLEEAMAHYCNSQIERMKFILTEIQKFKELDQQQLLSMLQELQQLLDSLDKGETLYKMGGHVTILKIIFYCKFNSCRILALQIYSSANQNDSYVQNISINTGALQMIQLFKKEDDIKLRQNLLTAISATIRGQNLEAKRIFIKINGLELLIKTLHLKESLSQKLEHKIYILFRDLLYYDDNLHKTYNDLSNFSNTNSINPKDLEKIDTKNKNGLTYDVNQQVRSSNQLIENQMFKGIVKKNLQADMVIFQRYLQWLKEQIKNQNQQSK